MEKGDLYLVLLDTAGSSEHPGWGLRNVLLLAAVKWGLPELRVISVRGRLGFPNPDISPVLRVKLPLIDPGQLPSSCNCALRIRRRFFIVVCGVCRGCYRSPRQQAC